MTQSGRALYADPRFVGYILARTLSFLGDNVWWIAVGWSAAQLDDPRLTGLVLAATGVPRAALMLFGGVAADLRGARPIMLAADVLAGSTALVAAFVTVGEAPSAALLIGVGIVFGTLDAFYLPAANSYLAWLLDRPQLPKGAAIRQFSRSGAETLGSGLGGVLVALGGFSLAAFVNGATFLACFGILLFVRPRVLIKKPAEEPGVRAALLVGLRYVLAQPLIRSLAFVTLILNGVVVPMTTIGLVLKANELGWGPAGYGLVAGFLGGGMVVGGLVGAVVKTPNRAGYVLTLWLVAALPGLGGMVFSNDMMVVCASAGMWSLCVGPCNAILSGLLLTATKPALLGRVQSVVTVLSNAMTPLGTAAFGVMVGLVGLTAVGTACLTCGVLTAAWMLTSPVVSRAELSDPSDESPRTTVRAGTS
jgi:MFS family permease